MTARKSATPTCNLRHNRCERLKDEVYRQMLRLEASYPGAEMGLALALLRAWIDIDSMPKDDSDREWLTKISPICFVMIEDSLHLGATSKPCPR